jgi:hypothetical protein
MRLPAAFVHENGLNAGDFILWDPANFKLIKQSTIDAIVEPAAMSEEAVEAAE